MPDRELSRCRILLVEDEYLLADELATELIERGATVLGPVPDVKAALALVDGGGPLDGAILDLSLGGEPAFPVVDRLVERGVPVILTTGYDAAALPERFRQLTRCEKPVSVARIAATLSSAIHA